MERADGLDLLTALDRRPWIVLRVGQTMARCHAALHKTRAPDRLPILKEHLSDALQRSPLVPGDIRQFVSTALERLPDGDRLCHGDFHPGNIIMTRRGPVVIDWAGGARGDPHADVALSLLLLKMGEIPEGAPLMIRTLAGFGRRVIRGRYLATYHKLSPLDDSLLSEWLIAVAAHRLTANLPPERRKLIAVIESAMRGPQSGVG